MRPENTFIIASLSLIALCLVGGYYQRTFEEKVKTECVPDKPNQIAVIYSNGECAIWPSHLVKLGR